MTPSLPDSLLRHFRPEQRDLVRSIEFPGELQQVAQLSVLRDSLTFRVAVYERLHEKLPAIRHKLPNYDQLIRELTLNRLACLVLDLYLQVRLAHYHYASGLLSRLLRSTELVSVPPEWNRLVDELLGYVLVYENPAAAIQLGRAASTRTVGSDTAAALVVASLCDAISKGAPEQALQTIRAAKERGIESATSGVCEAVCYLEAEAHRQSGHLKEEFEALRRWRNTVTGGIGLSAATAKVAGRESRERALLSAANRLLDLATAQGDLATASGIAEDLRLHQCPLHTNAGQTGDAAPPTTAWELLTLSPNLGRPIKQALTEFFEHRKHALAYVAVEAPYAATASRSYPKAPSVLDMVPLLTATLEQELEYAGDLVTAVTPMPHPDNKRSQWLVCARQGEPFALGVRLLNQGDSFTIHLSPLIAGPPGLPDHEWLSATADAIAQMGHRGPSWHTDIEKIIDRAARSLSPSLAPLEISHAPIRELE
jgi:hypothetical protein